MKKLIVIGSYPNTPRKEEVLISEIKSLKSIGFDFMLVSHYPVSSEIQHMVDYYIYEKNQILTPLDKTTYYWFKTDFFILRVNNSRHALPICQNMYNAFKMAELKDYDFVFFAENDNIFSEEDSIKLSGLVDEAITNNKSGIFFKPHDYQDNHSKVYETQMFGINPKRFNEIFKIPLNGDDFFTHPDYPVSLELGFYNSLKDFESEFIIVDEHSYNYFKTSEVNIFRVEDFLVDLLYNSTNEEQPVLFVHNRDSKTLRQARVVVSLDGEIVSDETPSSGVWYYQSFSYNGKKLKVEVFMDGDLEIIREYRLDSELRETIKEKGIIDFY